MKKLKSLIFGIRTTGYNIIVVDPKFNTTSVISEIGFGDWIKQLNVGQKAPETRIVIQGNKRLAMPNIKLAYE
jgi:hypothetical protein